MDHFKNLKEDVASNDHINFAAKYLTDAHNTDQVEILNKIKDKIQSRKKIPWNLRLKHQKSSDNAGKSGAFLT